VQRQSRLPGYWLSCTISCAGAEQGQKPDTGKNYILIPTTDINDCRQIVASASDIYNAGCNSKTIFVRFVRSFALFGDPRTSPRTYFAYDREHSIAGQKRSRLLYRHWRPSTEYSEQPLPIESQTETILRSEFRYLLLPLFVSSRANVLQVVFEKSAVLVQVKQAVFPCAVHRALHLVRKRCRRFCHLILSRRTRVIPLSVNWPLHCKICDVSRTLGECLSRRRPSNEEANFCKAKRKKRGARDSSTP